MIELSDELKNELLRTAEKARELVINVNKVLGEENDPLGVLSWWTSHNAYLGAMPYELIWEPDLHADVLRAAEALLETP